MQLCRLMFVVVLIYIARTVAAEIQQPDGQQGPDGGVTVRVATVSFVPQKFDLAGNADRLDHLFRQAAQGGAKIAVAPEGALDGYVVNEIIAGEVPAERMKEVGIPLDHPTIQRFQRLARELEMCLAFGLAERIGDDVYNCAVFIDHDGRICSKYHKMQFAEGYDPSWWYNRLGLASRAFDTPYGRCGMLICNDRWNPLLAQISVLDGARFLLIPAMGSRSEAQDAAVLSRGKENNVPVVEANVGVTLVASDGAIVAVDRHEEGVTFGDITIPPAIASDRDGRDRVEPEFLKWRETEIQARLQNTLNKLQENAAAAQRDARPDVPRILFNTDGGAAAFYKFQPDTIAGGLHELVDDLADTQVDVFIACINHSDDQLYYSSQVAEYYGQHHDGVFLEREQSFQQAGDNIRGLVSAGLDPLKIWADRTHQHGMKFWASMRMNDVHKDHADVWPSLRSKWEKENNVRIGDDLPDHYKDARLSYTWAMDYGRQEVRDHKFAIVEEVCQRHYVDGFEMDFQRAPYFFRHGQRDQVTPLMTGFVRRVRRRMDEISGEQNRPLVLAVRVPETLDRASLLGLDVAAWIQENLVDVVIPMHTGYLDMNAHVADYVALTRGTDCQIYAGLELNVTDYSDTKKGTGKMLRAAASGYYEEGAAGIYLFNYDAHSPQLPFLPEHKQPFRELGDAQLLAGKDKHYFITRDMRGQTAVETWPPLHKVGGEMQLPATLHAGKTLQLRFTVGDNLEAARGAGRLESLHLVVGINDLQSSDQITVQVNGQFAGEDVTEGNRLVFAEPPVQQGTNRRAISQNHSTGRSLRVERAELLIAYSD